MPTTRSDEPGSDDLLSDEQAETIQTLHDLDVAELLEEERRSAAQAPAPDEPAPA